ncbi:MAG: hypothetical protein CMO97_02900 [Woeseia sp.]|nr:hypothetical protein [Woeseia sp.]|tara:strand:- start:3978 stop:4211 length:234 start_codon:yes stop_codon:yes gene_type:complete
MKKNEIENLTRKLIESIPDGVNSIRADLEKNFREILSSNINRLDLVTREEFEIQKEVLNRTRKKLEKLEIALQKSKQ